MKDIAEALGAFVEQSLAGFYVIQNGKLVFVNARAEQIFGYRPEEMVGMNALDIVAEKDRPVVAEHIRRRLSGEVGSAHYEVQGLRRDGSIVHLEIHGSRSTLHGQPVIAGVVIDVTERREQQRRFTEIMSVLTEAVYAVDERGRLTYMNRAAETMLGWKHEDLLGKNAHYAFHHLRPDGSPYPASECSVHLAKVAGQHYHSHDDHLITKDGAFIPVAMSAAPIYRDGRPAGAVVACHDIRERLKHQRTLEDNEARLRLLFNVSMDAIFVHPVDDTGMPGRFVEVNDVACERLGYSRVELLDMSPMDINAPDTTGLDIRSVIEQLTETGAVTFERIHLAKDGRRIPVEINARMFEHDGQPMVISLARDNTRRKKAEEEIYHLAHYDMLTDLPNRRLLMDRLDRAVASASRHGRSAAVLMLDLDGFKPVNDTHGHAMGDEVLKVIARRLLGNVRKGDTVARFGGDEFVVVLCEISALTDAHLVADKIIRAINEPIRLPSKVQVRIGTSIGIATFPETAVTSESLLQAADAALYHAKAQGKNRCVIHGAMTPPETASRVS